MTVNVPNTELTDSFNTWRLNSNFYATVISNNAVTVSRAGSANRGGLATGNAHIIGTFSADELRATTIQGGNTTNESLLVLQSNVEISGTGAREFDVYANTIFNANVDFNVTGTNRLTLGDMSRIRVTGGTAGQFLRREGSSDVLDFKGLTLRDIQELQSNSSHITLNGANTSFSPQNDSPKIIMRAGAQGADRAEFYLASGVSLTESDVVLKLVESAGASAFKIQDSDGSTVFTVDSDGGVIFTSNAQIGGVETSSHILPGPKETLQSNGAYDIGQPTRRFRQGHFNESVTANAFFGTTLTVNGAVTHPGADKEEFCYADI